MTRPQPSPNASDVIRHAQTCPACGPVLTRALAEVRDHLTGIRPLCGACLSGAPECIGMVIDPERPQYWRPCANRKVAP